MKKYLALILLLLPFLWGCPDTTSHSRGTSLVLYNPETVWRWHALTVEASVKRTLWPK
jgi:hypothetical protein